MNNSWLNLEDKVVIVTGGASGIGRACVDEFIADGAKVTVADMNPDAPSFGAGAGKLIYIRCDVTKKADVDKVVEQTLASFGRIDVLVNNAGINIPRLLVDPAGQFELDEGIWDKVMNVNLKGAFLMAQAAARVMMKQKSGVIVNISSESGLEGSEGQSVYAATKAALNSLTRSWCKELGRHGIRVVGIAPGIIEATGLRSISYETSLAYTRGITVEQLRENYNKNSTIPLGRPGKLTEIASTVAFMASERSGYIHGVTVNIAGGKTRG
jgi:sorbitol-6-phosphate 2-dehydrogenase